MSLAIVDRPIGFILGESFNLAVSNNVGFALVNFSGAHGLTTGDLVYVRSNIIDYSGRFYVNVVDSDSIALRPYNSFGSLGFIVEAPITLYKTTTHGWNAVHLPIKYAIENDKWPENTLTTTYPVRTITSVIQSDASKCRVSVGSGMVTGDTLRAYDYVVITNSSDSRLNGVYQVDAVNSDIQFNISLAYSAANDTALTGASVQFCYNNYCLKVRVNAGIPIGHVFEDQKPLELISEIAVTPYLFTGGSAGDHNVADFSIAEIVRAQILTQNETLLATLPNNIDFWTAFYINFAESYDLSNGTDITTFTSTYQGDSFLGYASNSSLPFKNVFSGYMSDYVATYDEAKFLTLFDEPVLTSGYQDISFILPVISNDTILVIKKYSGDTLQSTEEVTVSQYYEGVYRHELEVDCDMTSMKVQLFAIGQLDFANFTNYGTVLDWSYVDPAWVVSSA